MSEIFTFVSFRLILRHQANKLFMRLYKKQTLRKAAEGPGQDMEFLSKNLFFPQYIHRSRMRIGISI